MRAFTKRAVPLAVCATLFALAAPARLPAGDLQVDGKLVSTSEPGTPPLQVSSPAQFFTDECPPWP